MNDNNSHLDQWSVASLTSFMFAVSYYKCSDLVPVPRGGAPIGAGGVMTPPLFEAKGDGGGHNLGIIH